MAYSPPLADRGGTHDKDCHNALPIGGGPDTPVGPYNGGPPMSYLTFTLKHGMTLADARSHLRTAVGEVCTRFRLVVQQVDWSADGGAVKITGRGFDIDMRVDEQDL